jgi:hypothetical protein
MLLLASAAIAGFATAAPNPLHHHPLQSAVATVDTTTEAQLQVLRGALTRYADFEVARREGWKKFGGNRSGESPLMGEHWLLPKERGGVDYQHGQSIDFSRPSNLIYAEIDRRRRLIGVTFNVRLAEGEPVPEGFAGPADRWHVHDFPKAIAAATEGRPLLRWLASSFAPAEFTRPGAGRGRVAMIHVWPTLPNPDGPFADRHRVLPYLKLGLRAEFADGASVRAAKGLHLATPRGCADTIDGALWVANAPGATAKRLHSVCKAAAEHVKEGLSTGRKPEVNAMAEHGWAMFSAAWERALTPAQQARIATITEHGDAGPLAHEGESGHSHH